MLPIIIFSIIFISSFATEYEELSKYNSVRVLPDTRVYLDISSYKVDDLIKFELSMDLRSSVTSRSGYSFFIGQVYIPATYTETEFYWNDLPKVIDKNVTCDSSYYCYFKWNEIKQFWNNYIYIIPSAPYKGFYSTKRKIKVNHLGGLSVGAIVGIVLGSIGGVVLLIVIIYFSCCRPKKPDNIPNNPQAAMTTIQPIMPEIEQPISPVTVQPIAPISVQPISPLTVQPISPASVQPIAPVQPLSPTYGPPPLQPYVYPVVN